MLAMQHEQCGVGQHEQHGVCHAHKPLAEGCGQRRASCPQQYGRRAPRSSEPFDLVSVVMGDGWVGEWVTRHRKCIRSHQPMSATLRTPVYTRDCCFFVREMTATPRRSCRDAALAWRPGHPRGAGACAREQLETAHTTMISAMP
jgi:hypothetical protein